MKIYTVKISFGTGLTLDNASNDINRFRKHGMDDVELDGLFDMNIKRAYQVTIGTGGNLKALYQDSITWLDGVLHDMNMLFMHDSAKALRHKLIDAIEHNELGMNYIVRLPISAFALRFDVSSYNNDDIEYHPVQ